MSVRKRNSKKTARGATATRQRREHALLSTVARAVFWVLVAVLICALLVGTFYGLERVFFSNNPHFTLRHIKVDATGQMKREDVVNRLAQIGIKEGHTNVFEIDLGAVRKHLEMEVLVHRASVVRRLPDQLVISVYERRPIAQVRRQGRQLLDADGWFLPPRHDAESLALPVITGIRGGRRLSTEGQTTDEVLLAALQFLRLIAVRPDGQQYDVAMIQLDYSFPSLSVHLRPRGTFRKGTCIVLPVRDMREALDRVADIVAERTSARQETSFIDATYKINVPVRP